MKNQTYVSNINPHKTAKITQVKNDDIKVKIFIGGKQESESTFKLDSFLRKYTEIKNIDSYHENLKRRIHQEELKEIMNKDFTYKKTKKSVQCENLEFACLDCDYKPKPNLEYIRAKKCLMRHILKNGHRGSIKETKTTIYEPLD